MGCNLIDAGRSRLDAGFRKIGAQQHHTVAFRMSSSSVSIFLISSRKSSKQSLLTGGIETILRRPTGVNLLLQFQDEMHRTSQCGSQWGKACDEEVPGDRCQTAQVVALRTPGPSTGIRQIPPCTVWHKGSKVAFRNHPPHHRTPPSEKIPGKEPQASVLSRLSTD